MTDLLVPLASAERTLVIASYRHWGTDAAPDVAAEAGRCVIGADDLVVAKSMGTMVLLEAIASGPLPARVVLIGTPLNGYTETQLGELKALSARIPCLFIQQTDDFTGSHAQVLAAVDVDSSKSTVRQVDGSDHNYADTDELTALIRHWWQSEEASHG